MHRYATQRGRFAVLAAAALLFVAANAHPQVSSITTKLLGRIDSRRISEGAPFFVKTISAWKEGRCTIPLGMTLEGRIAKVVKRGPGIKREELDLRFLRIPCPGDDTQAVTPILVAMHGPQKNSNDDMLAREEILTAFASVAAAHSPNPGAVGGRMIGPVGVVGTATGTVGGRGGFSSMSSNQDSVRAGEVRDFPGIKLALPTLTSDPTVLTSTGELLFDPDARLVIVMRVAPSYAAHSPAVEMARADSSSTASRAGGSFRAVHSDPPPLIENCVSGGCVTAPDATQVVAEQAQTEISLRDLAYRPRTTRTIAGGLEDEDAIVFLGNDQIFVTFNTHALVPRSETEAERSSSPRQIRGVLISAVDGRRLRVVDWLVPEQGTYLWPLDNGRLMVHVGNALVVYTRDLEEEARWEIPGPLVFVTISPSRNSILAAVTHERYDPATFRRLADFVGSTEKVQEDCDLIALNSHLEQTASHRLTQIPAPPALLDAGLISATRATRSRWKIEQTDWDKHLRQLAQLTSACAPLIQSLPGNLLFLSGCEADSKSKWYRVLRSDGRTLLRGTTTNQAIPEYVDASSTGNVFAIGVERADRDVDWNTGMHIADLGTMTVAVYRAADGKQFYATKVPSHAVDRRVLALSPSGERLAVLTDSTVRIYRTKR